LFSEAAFIFKFKFTAWVVRSSTYVPFIPLQLSWQPITFLSASRRSRHVMSRRSCRAEWSVVLVGHSSRSLWGSH